VLVLLPDLHVLHVLPQVLRDGVLCYELLFASLAVASA
jgi:hypothetical protein